MFQRVDQGSLGVEGAKLLERYQKEPCFCQHYQAWDTQALVTLELACCNRKVTRFILFLDPHSLITLFCGTES